MRWCWVERRYQGSQQRIKVSDLNNQMIEILLTVSLQLKCLRLLNLPIKHEAIFSIS